MGNGKREGRVGQLPGLPEALADYRGQGRSGTDGRNSCARSQLGRAPHPVGRWVLASELGREQGLGLGSSWQPEDFQVVAVGGAWWGQVHRSAAGACSPSNLNAAWLRPYGKFFVCF